MTIVVFSFGLLPLITLFQKSQKVTAQAKNLMVAQSLGRTLIDEVRSYGFEGIRKNISRLSHSWEGVKGPVLLRDPTSPPDPNAIEYPKYYNRFETQTAITPYPTVNPEKFQVCLTVRWVEPGREGGSYSLFFGTVVVKYGAK